MSDNQTNELPEGAIPISEIEWVRLPVLTPEQVLAAFPAPPETAQEESGVGDAPAPACVRDPDPNLPGA
jgi:hypothetical protein